VSTIAGLDYWTGLLDWTTGLDYWTGLLDWTTGPLPALIFVRSSCVMRYFENDSTRTPELGSGEDEDNIKRE